MRIPLAIITAALLLTGPSLFSRAPRADDGAARQYVVLTRNNQRDLAAAVAAVGVANGHVINASAKTGVVLASSSDPSFVETLSSSDAVESVAEDVEIQWIPAGIPQVEVESVAPEIAGVKNPHRKRWGISRGFTRTG